MYGNIRIGKCTLRTWWYIFYLTQLILIILSTSVFFVQSWAISDFHIKIEKTNLTNQKSYSGSFNGKFKGSFNSCIEGCLSTYSTESKDWCEIFTSMDKIREYYTNNPYYLQSKSLCSMFHNLYLGMIGYLLLQIISLLTVFIWFVTMICFVKRTKCFWTSYFCAGCSCLSQLISFLMWFGITGARFGDMCSVFPLDGSNPPICAGDGPGLGIAVIISFSLATFGYVIITCIAYPRRSFIDSGIPAVQLGNKSTTQQTSMFYSNAVPYIFPPQPPMPGSPGTDSLKSNDSTQILSIGGMITFTSFKENMYDSTKSKNHNNEQV
ncbi:hypothetical protein SteCoe_32282 [Stentor coeruleus]|uniref:Uncharacterized protein n=1 Tax=Stentor coeruleus TaxID=5963 RepID=A0A1R2AZC5_9CILI|nr:hypothetical protein SteCoe_32282 [Stentor coeruleus]